MLRLNNSSVVRESINGIDTVQMSAVFDDVTKTGRTRRMYAQCFAIKDNFLILDGLKHQLCEPVDLNADPEDLIAYFLARFGSVQPDIFIKPPSSRRESVVPKSIKEVRWEYPNMPWRAIDKSGAVAYFERRPMLDKAGYWVAAIEGIVARYGKSLCIADNYQCSLRNISDQG
ncbi:hypothetical protein [Psychrobacter alimentarius]|uniref:hypothetical protein n=1 Tax=Psychrobacter alimentarius TaxID=261164 RepID=UPI003FD55939